MNDDYDTYVSCFHINEKIILAMSIGNKSVSFNVDENELKIKNVENLKSHYLELDFDFSALDKIITISW